MPHAEPMLDDNDQILDAAFNIIGEAISIEPDDFQDHETWTYLGLKGLLASATAKDLQSQLPAIVLPDEVFTQYPTVGSLKAFLRPGLKSKPDPWQTIPKPKFPLSVILQGDPKTAIKTIFLFPDGSGTGMSYKTLPPLASTTCLVALNSPFLGSPTSFTDISIQQMASLWLPELLKHHPDPARPFVLGGWSAGGYYAYETCHLLTSSGYKVDRLILIDSPCRLRYEALPVAVVDELTAKGYMGSCGDRKAPDWLVKHFTATVQSVDNYMPVPLKREHVPQLVDFLWAREGLVENVEKAGLVVDLSVKVTRFLLEPRRELRSEGWEDLVPGAEYSFGYLTGNHFQITQTPHSDHLGHLLRGILE